MCPYVIYPDKRYMQRGCEALGEAHPDKERSEKPRTRSHGNGIKIGRNVFVNYNVTMLDGGMITIGDNCLIGPNCQLYTPQHPFDHVLRRKSVETAYPITIGEDTWLGGGVVVCPGVTIGKRCIIGAGSVVTKDIPDDCVAAGNPARVIRELKVKS